jgi:protein-S-isoprenylcysteine O-methyltransferase Ste14
VCTAVDQADGETAIVDHRATTMSANAQQSAGNPLRFLMYVPVPWVFVLAYLLGVAVERALRPAAAAPLRMLPPAAGAVLLALGVLIAGWSLTLFRRARTTTVPGKASASLVTSGPYRFTRNPMYVALSLAYLGEAGLLKQVWPLVFLPLVLAYLNWVVIPVEEARLREVFGERYDRYRASVRRWL